jgi:hypothetical protein
MTVGCGDFHSASMLVIDYLVHGLNPSAHARGFRGRSSQGGGNVPGMGQDGEAAQEPSCEPIRLVFSIIPRETCCALT